MRQAHAWVANSLWEADGLFLAGCLGSVGCKR